MRWAGGGGGAPFLLWPQIPFEFEATFTFIVLEFIVESEVLLSYNRVQPIDKSTTPFYLYSPPTMAKQATRKPTAKKAIKAGKSATSTTVKLGVQRNVSSAKTAAARRNKMAILQQKREEAQRRAREWAKRELGGKKVASSFSHSASTAAPVVYSSEDDDKKCDEDADDDEEKEGSINVDPKNCIQHNFNQMNPFDGFHQSSIRGHIDAESVDDDDIFFDAMESLEVDERVDPNAAELSSAPTSANIRDFYSSRQSLASKQVQFQQQRQQSTKARPSLDPVGYSFSTFVSKPNP